MFSNKPAMTVYSREILRLIVLSHHYADMNRCSCGWFVSGGHWSEHGWADHVIHEYELLERTLLKIAIENVRINEIVKPEKPPTSESGVSRSGDGTR